MRFALKRFLFGLAVIVISPLIILTLLEALIFGKDTRRIFGGCAEILSLVPSIIGNYFRKAYYWGTCTNVSPDTHFLFGVMLARRENTIRRGVSLGVHTYIGYADIGENVLFGARISIISGKYQHGKPSERKDNKEVEESHEVIKIGDNSWIGSDSSILANIGSNCTVGAGSVVLKDVPDGWTVMGNPARKVNVEPAK